MDVEGTDSRKLKTKELAWWDRIGGQLVDIFASCFLVARYRWKNYLLVVKIISARISNIAAGDYLVDSTLVQK